MKKWLVAGLMAVCAAPPLAAQSPPGYTRSQLGMYFSGATGVASPTNCWPTGGGGTSAGLISGETMRACMLQYLASTPLFENVASVAQIWNGAVFQIIDSAQAQISLHPTTVALVGTQYTPDLALGINFDIVLTAACSLGCTLRAFPNPLSGASGTIWVQQPASGGPASLGTYDGLWKFSGGTHPTWSTGASALDKLTYDCRSVSVCTLDFGKGYQ